MHRGHLVGYVDLHGCDRERRELSFLVGPAALWGRGLGLAVARAGLTYGFDELRLREVWAQAIDANRASIRTLQRLGMAETGPGGPAAYLGHTSRYRQFTVRASP